jgi:hypothetical protein
LIVFHPDWAPATTGQNSSSTTIHFLMIADSSTGRI